MDVVYAYLDTMFSPYASSPRLDAAKEELRGMMEDAYSARVAQGNSHNEAVGAVIAEFGNLDELAEVLGISTELNRASSAHADDAARDATSPGSATPNSDDAAARGANPAGAHAPHAAPSGARPRASAADGSAAAPPAEEPRAGSFTAGSTRAGSTRAGSAASGFTETRFIDPDSEARQAHRPSDNRDQWWDYGRKWANRDDEPGTRVDIFAAVFWPVITSIYLLWSFIWKAWAVSWLIWPIAGVLFGPAVIIASAWSNRRGRRKNDLMP